MRTAIIALLGLSAVLACATTMPTIPASTVLAEASGVDAAVLDRGRALWTRECAACHRTYWPSEYTPERWKSLGPDMGDRSGLGPEEIEALTKFLVTASRYTRSAEPNR
jgi:hypothetical protein